MPNRLPSEVLQGALDDAYDASVTAANTLRAQLRAYETAKWETNSSGQVVANVSRNNAAGGQSTSFFAPAMSGFNPTDIQIAFRNLINLYDQVVITEELTDTTTDRLAIKTEMMGLLKPCTEYAQDFSLLRTGRAAAV